MKRETEVAKLLGLPINTIRRWRKEGKLQQVLHMAAPGAPILVSLKEVREVAKEHSIYIKEAK